MAALAHETKTEAIRRALLERRVRLKAHGAQPAGRKGLQEFMEKNIWPFIPESARGRMPTREEEDEILGFGPDGV